MPTLREQEIQAFAKQLIDNHTLPELLTALTIEINHELQRGELQELGVSLRGNTVVAYLFKYLAFKFENHPDAFKNFIFQNYGNNDAIKDRINTCWNLYIEQPKQFMVIGFGLEVVKQGFAAQVKQTKDTEPEAEFPTPVNISLEKRDELEITITQFHDPDNPKRIIEALRAIKERLMKEIEKESLRNELVAIVNSTEFTLIQISKQINITYQEKKLTCQKRLYNLQSILTSYPDSVKTLASFQELMEMLPKSRPDVSSLPTTTMPTESAASAQTTTTTTTSAATSPSQTKQQMAQTGKELEKIFRNGKKPSSPTKPEQEKSQKPQSPTFTPGSLKTMWS